MSDLPERIHVQWDQWEGTHLVAKTDPGKLAKAPYAEYVRADLVDGQRMIVIEQEDTRAREVLERFYQWVVRKQYGHLGYVPEDQEELREKITLIIYQDIWDIIGDAE